MIKLHVGSFRVRSIRTSSLTARILLACLCIVFQLIGGASAQEFRASKLAAPITALSLCKGIGDYQSAGFTCVSQQRPFDLNDKIWFKILEYRHRPLILKGARDDARPTFRK